jgi:hypothetical protein
MLVNDAALEDRNEVLHLLGLDDAFDALREAGARKKVRPAERRGSEMAPAETMRNVRRPIETPA